MYVHDTVVKNFILYLPVTYVFKILPIVSKILKK